MGCKGPNTFNSCAVIKWNEGVSYPIQSGHGCIGCAEPGFWDAEPLYHHLPDVRGFGIEATADQIGLGLTAVAAAGVAAHAIVTNIQKRKLIKTSSTTTSPTAKPLPPTSGTSSNRRSGSTTRRISWNKRKTNR